MPTSSINIKHSLLFLNDVINLRLKHFLKKENSEFVLLSELKPEFADTPLDNFRSKHKLNNEEYIIILLALAPHIKSNFLETIIQQYLPEGGDFPEFGGVKENNHRAMLPTGETAVFIIAGNDFNKRILVLNYFSGDHFFAKENILQLEQVKDGEPIMSGRIILKREYIDIFTTGRISKPKFGPDFPAKLISTKNGLGRPDTKS